MGMLEKTFGLSGRRAMVTGAARGIGKGIAEMLAGCGAAVIVADRDGQRGQETASEIIAAGGAAQFLSVNIKDELSVVGLFEAAGPIDILVNNAAMIGMMPLTETPSAFWNEVQAVNAQGTFLCMREAAKRMRKAGKGGRIINISSSASLHPSVYGSSAYAASKGAVNAITRTAALELAPDGILINAVLPDAIHHQDSVAQFLEHELPVPSGPSTEPARRPLGRAGQVHELASLVTFLAGPGASYITGQCFVADGGFFVS